MGILSGLTQSTEHASKYVMRILYHPCSIRLMRIFDHGSCALGSRCAQTGLRRNYVAARLCLLVLRLTNQNHARRRRHFTYTDCAAHGLAVEACSCEPQKSAALRRLFWTS